MMIRTSKIRARRLTREEVIALRGDEDVFALLVYMTRCDPDYDEGELKQHFVSPLYVEDKEKQGFANEFQVLGRVQEISGIYEHVDSLDRVHELVNLHFSCSGVRPRMHTTRDIFIQDDSGEEMLVLEDMATRVMSNIVFRVEDFPGVSVEDFYARFRRALVNEFGEGTMAVQDMRVWSEAKINEHDIDHQL